MSTLSAIYVRAQRAQVEPLFAARRGKVELRTIGAWVEASYDWPRFEPQLGQEVSRALQAEVVVALVQTTASVFCFERFLGGASLRAIMVGDDTPWTLTGAPEPWEGVFFSDEDDGEGDRLIDGARSPIPGSHTSFEGVALALGFSEQREFFAARNVPATRVGKMARGKIATLFLLTLGLGFSAALCH